MASMTALDDFGPAVDTGSQQRFSYAMNDEIGVAANRRSEMRVGRRGEREVAFIDLRVARLAQRAKHEVAEDPFLGLAFDAGSELLIHLWRNGDVFGDFVGADLAATSLRIAPITARLDALDGKCAKTEGVAEAGGEFFELHDAARVRASRECDRARARRGLQARWPHTRWLRA